MFLLENFIQAIAFTLDSLLSIYFWIVLISALLSWVNPDPRNPIVRFLYNVTEPVLYHIRRRLPFVVAARPHDRHPVREDARREEPVRPVAAGERHAGHAWHLTRTTGCGPTVMAQFCRFA